MRENKWIKRPPLTTTTRVRFTFRLIDLFRNLVLQLFLFSPSIALAKAWDFSPHPNLPSLKQKAEGGDPAAMADYASHSLRCLGNTPYDQELIFDYFSRSAEAGDIDGVMGLAHCYLFAVGTAPNYQISHDLAEEGVKIDHPVALRLMGELYNHTSQPHHSPIGQAVKRPFKGDYGTSKTFFEKSALKGNSEAIFQIAKYHIEPKRGYYPSDRVAGAEELVKLCQQDCHPLAAVTLLELISSPFEKNNTTRNWQFLDKQAQKYCQLGEPRCLYFYAQYQFRKMHDSKKGLEFMLRSAKKGFGPAWLFLADASNRKSKYWRYGKVFKTTENTHGRMMVEEYLKGSETTHILNLSSLFIVQNLHEPAYQERLPRLKQDLEKFFRQGFLRKFYHSRMGLLYLGADPEEYPDLHKPERGIAHLLCSPGRIEVSALSRYFFSLNPTDENLARGYACAQLCRKKKWDNWQKIEKWNTHTARMTPAALELARTLSEDQYPQGKKTKKAAQLLLQKVGELP